MSYNNPAIINKFNDALAQARNAAREAGYTGHVSISDRNSKMGAIASVSTLPIITCPARCRKTCAGICYAAKLANLRPSVMNAYARNTAIAIERPDQYWEEIRYFVQGVRYFRFHVSGDIMNKAYFSEMVKTAQLTPGCEFLAFTKRFELVNAWIKENGPLPANMHIIFSKWGDMPVPNPYHIPCSAVVFKGCDPDPDWKVCGGNCFNCACRGVGCWTLAQGETVCFKQH